MSVVPLNGRPKKLCGSQPPAPFEVTGGNITVTHHLSPHLYPISGFYLYYIKGTEEQSQFFLFTLHDMFINVSEMFQDFRDKLCFFHPWSLSSTSSDSGRCFPGEFECYSKRCLPASWRCNGRVECLGEGDELDSDEDGCDDVSPEPHIDYPLSSLDTTTTMPNFLSNTDLPSPKEPDFPLLSQGGPCGGYLDAFYGSFTPPVLTGRPLECVWTVDPQDSRPLKLELQHLELGPGDKIIITDQPNGAGKIIKTVSSTVFKYVCMCKYVKFKTKNC